MGIVKGHLPPRAVVRTRERTQRKCLALDGCSYLSASFLSLEKEGCVQEMGLFWVLMDG